MFKDNIYTYIFIFLGIGFITIGYFISKPAGKTSFKPQLLGQIEKLSGNASITRKNQSRSHSLRESESLQVLDTIETHKQSQVELQFNNGTQIRLNAETKVIIDQERDNLLIILSKGKFSIENYGNQGLVFVSYQGQRIRLQEWEGWLSAQSNSNKAANGLNSYNSNEKLSETIISDTIQVHKTKFLQCYNKLLQKTPGVSGSVTLAFTIEKSGRVSNPNVASSVLTDSSFKSCLFEVLNRIEFKAFEGEPISTVIPLNFE
ncbi:MAG: AgmX/PglI C-terminal domain-containing protein [Bdellovibrionaceae bacterium]|nr:AgmX/PglI C-terminal domain-containing protein [Pseudobdellovibrionaceae bacterium]